MDDISKNFLSSGICPHCYKHILDIVGKEERIRWIAVKVESGSFKTSFYLPDLINEKLIPEGSEWGSISSPSEIPEELPKDYIWVCPECYSKIKKRNSGDDKPPEERWIDSLDDWQ